MQELRHAVVVELGDTSIKEVGLPDEDLVESICAGILTIQENGTVRLVYYTAREHLERHSTTLFPGAHSLILRTCV